MGLKRGMVPTQIHPGTNGKIAVVARSMGGKEGQVGVKDFAASLEKHGLEADVFDGPEKITDAAKDQWRELNQNERKLSYEEVQATRLYQENSAWVNRLKENGYTVVDLGNPNNFPDASAFYDMEILTSFGVRP